MCVSRWKLCDYHLRYDFTPCDKLAWHDFESYCRHEPISLTGFSPFSVFKGYSFVVSLSFVLKLRRLSSV